MTNCDAHSEHMYPNDCGVCVCRWYVHIGRCKDVSNYELGKKFHETPWDMTNKKKLRTTTATTIEVDPRFYLKVGIHDFSHSTTNVKSLNCSSLPSPPSHFLYRKTFFWSFFFVYFSSLYSIYLLYICFGFYSSSFQNRSTEGNRRGRNGICMKMYISIHVQCIDYENIP